MARVLKFWPALLLLVEAAPAFSAENTTPAPPAVQNLRMVLSPAPSAQGVQITQLTNRLRVEINGQLFTEYFFKDVPRPYCYPLIGPAGAAMTRNWPMKTTPDEQHDHPHHRSLWFSHGSVNGHDFWSEAKGFGKIVHDKFTEIKSGKETGTIKSRDKWIAADSTLVCTDERTLRIYNPAQENERM